jgi:16S rRNA C967 or C1407 C5-methylase (RsmB/RsmF family)
MCAAPGSKTSQLVEMLHCDEGKAPGIIFLIIIIYVLL